MTPFKPLSVQAFKLDFGWGVWRAHVGYVATVSIYDKQVCQRTIDETAKQVNWYGFGTAQKVLNDAFSAAINELDFLTALFLLLKSHDKLTSPLNEVSFWEILNGVNIKRNTT